MNRKRDRDWTDATRKKPAKPRSTPIVALTPEDRAERAAEALEKAQIHLAEAEAMANWGDAPNACIHAAYFAMYFTAVSALYRAGGVGSRHSVPDSHEHVLQHYIKLAEAQGEPLSQSGKLLNRARDLRVESDYFQSAAAGVHSASAVEAAEITVVARSLLTNWTAVWQRGVNATHPSRP